MTARLENILGPRVPRDELRRRAGRYLLPTVLLIVAGALLIGSYTQPYWRMTLQAPQYPKGLHVQAYLNRLQGDVKEIDGLNHYIGMRPLNDAAKLERETSGMMVAGVAGLLLAAVIIHSRWAALAALPALLFPIGFLADLQYWLASFGTNLDRSAALSSSIKPFIPPVLGVGVIGQFKTIATPGAGFWMASAASLVVLVALIFHRRAYKPLLERRQAERRGVASAPAALVALALLSLTAPARADSADRLHRLIADAAAGATLVVPAGTYAAPVVIDKPLALVADGLVVIDARGAGDGVRIVAPDVTLRGFQIRATGDSLDQQNTAIVATAPRAVIENNTLEDVLLGVLLNGAPQSVVRGNRIRGKNLDPSRRGDGIRLWSSDGASVEHNEVVAVRDVVVWYSKDVRLIGNTVRDSRYGMHFMYASGGVLEENRLTENSVGVFLMYSNHVALRRNVFERNRGPSGYGIGLKDMDGVVADDNKIIGNRVGLYVDNSPSRTDVVQDFRRNIFAFNDVALAFLPAVQRNRFLENEFHENLEQVSILGSGELRNNDFTVAGRGNYWSDYAGFDADGDGLGDVPYRAMSLFESLIDREPKLRLFLYSPAEQAIELASRAFPIMRPSAKITDAAPLMQPVGAVPAARRASLAWPVSSLSAGLIALAALLAGLRRTFGASEMRVSEPSRGVAGADHNPPAHEPAPHAHAASGAGESRLSAAPIVEITGLCKAFGRHGVIHDFSLAVEPGEAVALWGTNGAGKTTLIKCILGLHTCRGAIRVGGFDAQRQGKAARRLVGYVSQEHSFYDDMTALDTARYFAALKRLPRSRAAEVLAQVELAPHAGKRVAQLSGGMKQRLALAVALLADPPILLLDEPTSNLDAAARRSFFKLLRALKAGGKTIVFTTHRSDELAGLADRVIVLEAGAAARESSPQSFGVSCVVRMTLGDDQRRAAHAVLRSAGFDVSSNCTAILVRTLTSQNAHPVLALAQAGIRIDTLDIESGECP